MAADVSNATMAQVLAALSTTEGQTPRQVRDRLNMWAVETIQNALRNLVEQGDARFTGKVCRRQYFRAVEVEAEPVRRSA